MPRPRRCSLHAALGLLGLVGVSLLTSHSSPAKAGARPLGLVMVDVIKDQGLPTCADRVRRAFGADLYVAYTMISPAALDKRLKKPIGEGWRTAGSKDFDTLMEWDAGRWFHGPKRTRFDEGDVVDTIVFIHCEPEPRRLELVSYNLGGGSRTAITVRGAEIDQLARLAAQRVLSIAWDQHSP